MILTANNIITGYAFCHNPIYVSDNRPFTGDMPENGFSYDVTLNGERVFSGRYYPPFNINVSDIAESLVTYFPEPGIKNNDVFVKLLDKASLPRLGIHALNGSEELTFSCILLPGGVSNRNWRRLAHFGKDIFSQRILNPMSNFFLTTRSNSWRLTLKETELAPLYFLIDEESSVRICDTLSGTSYSQTLEPGLWLLDIVNLRKLYAKTYNVLSSSFDIFRNEPENAKRSCRIVVTEAENSLSRTIVKFRNSFGLFEYIDLCGIRTLSTIAGDDESGFRKFDMLSNTFISERARTSFKRGFVINSGILKDSEMNTLYDMISSDEVYLLYPKEYPLRVIPSIEEFSRNIPSIEPFSVDIKFNLVDDESFITPDIITATEGVHSGIFSKEFAREFD